MNTNLLSDLRVTLRFVGRRPAVPLLIAGLFALSIGLTGGLWAVVDAVALRPLPYPDDRELVSVMESHPERGLMFVTPANFADWNERLHTLPHVVGLSSVEASLAGRETPTRVIGNKVTARFFDVVGVMPSVGRAFAAEDFRGDGRVVILANGLWQRQFAADPAVVGTSVLVDGDAHTVIGVMPRTFKMIGNADIWMPWVLTADQLAERRFHLVNVMARLRPAASAADAEQELRNVYRRLQAEHPQTTSLWTARVVPLREQMLGDSPKALAVLGSAVLAVLVLAAINVVGLQVVWLQSRRGEFRVRVALGASIGRLVRQLLTESLTYALAGLAGGVLLASAFVRVFSGAGVSPALEYDFAPAVDLRVILAMGMLLVFLSALTVMVPALFRGWRTSQLISQRGSATGIRGQRLALAFQVAVSVVLLCATVTLLDGFRSINNLAGPTQPSTLSVDITLAEGRYSDEDSQGRFFERLLTALQARGELRAVAAASYVPPARIFGNYRFAIDGPSPAEASTTLVSAVSPGFLQMLGVRVVEGRSIEEQDGPHAVAVAVISGTMARRHWRDGTPIGHRVTLAGTATPLTIVGVVDDARQPLSSDPRAESVLYVSYRQIPWPFMTVLFEPAATVAVSLAAIREEVVRLDPAQAIGIARPIDDVRREWLAVPRLRTRIVTIFGVAALLLTLGGLYARVSYSATSRACELAIRQAIGARPLEVIRLVAGEAFLVTVAGTAVGLTLLPSLLPWLQALVGGLPAGDRSRAAAIAILFLLAATWSASGPARVAGRADLTSVLRSD